MTTTTTTALETEAALHFVTPPPGLSPLTEFALSAVTEELYSLRAVDADGVRLFLVDPRPYFPEYAPRVSEEVLEELGTTDPAVLVVVRPGEGQAPTANLLAPVLVDLATGAAVQTILENSDEPLRAPLPR
ncbi:flagellar assembly factor FliW [Georgenia satyanarayanai]|uniref:Flagellar assembly factor FliW n=2 Tax=Georgenia satyanarayanai TaxID=860221 RepID=A0A2Y9A5Z6_9MICO|nr:flagellar assembly factor FliW [Georgenia satyanarayanai]SSA39326.1 flagellar assembly factor FliW [Georgenia satyanarayanai]